MNDEDSTLGQRLDGHARRIAARSVAGSPWAAPFGVLLDHLTDLPSPEGERFTRTENASAAPPVERPGRPLPPDTVARLRTVVGPGVETMRVHDDDAADETARAHRADAVTVGADVYFRHGKLDQERGFGLLVHEATHVVERFRPGARATAASAAAEENLALAREAAVTAGPPPPGRLATPAGRLLSAATHPPDPTPPGAPPDAPKVPFGTLNASKVPFGTPPGVSRGPLGSLDAPMAPFGVSAATALSPAIAAPHAAAPAARPMTAAVDRPTGAPPPVSAGIDVDALRGRIMRDLMRQLRDEFERGG